MRELNIDETKELSKKSCLCRQCGNEISVKANNFYAIRNSYSQRINFDKMCRSCYVGYRKGEYRRMVHKKPLRKIGGGDSGSRYIAMLEKNVKDRK